MRSRYKVVELIESWVGKNEKNGSHKEIIDIYNSFDGALPRGIKMQYNWAWCACTWSALAIKLGYTDIMPIEISCGYLIDEARKMGCWVENDNYIPKIGDAVLYDWQDNGIGNNIGWPDHIGVVTYVNEESGYFVVTEGNYNDQVKKRTISINGKYIRGFITPKYDEESDTNGPADDNTRRPGKTLTTIAHEVIAGIWGNGEERKTALSTYGYDPATIQELVNQILNGNTPVVEDSSVKQPVKQRVISPCYANYSDSTLAGRYETTANLYCRIDAGTNKKALCKIPKGSTVWNYGYYNIHNGSRWLLVVAVLDGVEYTGFSHKAYLKKV